mgnify:CR=1 FL=1
MFVNVPLLIITLLSPCMVPEYPPPNTFEYVPELIVRDVPYSTFPEFPPVYTF